MKKLIAAMAITGTMLTTAVFAADEDRAEWLFVHSADGVELVDETTLVVPLEREIFAFTDRPARDHLYLNAHEFVAIWNDGEDSFSQDPPNAVLTWEEDGEMRRAEIELTDAAVADHGRALHYQVSIVDGGMSLNRPVSGSLYIDSMAH
ncbi:hypothetical protein V6X63_08380 [Spiribacter sp. 221]|uniref:hypothetical protein n=1 Tax=Spiribacter onubensis TaxID=3122420 RepID=UPI00349F35A3